MSANNINNHQAINELIRDILSTAIVLICILDLFLFYIDPISLMINLYIIQGVFIIGFLGIIFGFIAVGLAIKSIIKNENKKLLLESGLVQRNFIDFIKIIWGAVLNKQLGSILVLLIVYFYIIFSIDCRFAIISIIFICLNNIFLTFSVRFWLKKIV